MNADDATLVEVAPGAHAWVQPEGGWWVNNAGLVTADHSGEALVVDTCVSSERTRRFLDAAAAATGGAPVRLAVNTHQHGDHTYGNHLLPESALIAAQEKARDGVLADPFFSGTPRLWEPMPDWSDAVLRPPSLTFRDSLAVHLGRRRVEVHHPGETAHTPGDAVVWLPAEKALFTGDLVFNRVTPLIFMGSLDGARRALDWMAAFGAEAVVPGHGPLPDGPGGVRRCLEEQARYYDLVQRAADRGRAGGLTPLQAARETDLGEFADWPDAERIVLNLHRVYADADGVEMDMGAAFADTLTYSGGPLHCEA
ncbi:MBL fold metallo-hydrolase [Nocardiopsis sp. CNT-189]|uniref:MBL fold metallo-hydrolase n=1 Tax=Nocardiopsis oceanisediminis TaxID=2816862 RepID=UPI003B2E8732